MTRAEKLLYHQIHPLKLATDVSTSCLSTWLIWDAHWVTAAIVAFVPSILITALVLSRVDLEPYKQSRFGRYVARFMTRSIEAVRFAGQFLAWFGAAIHVAWLIPAGYLIVLGAWLIGLVRGKSAPPA